MNPVALPPFFAFFAAFCTFLLFSALFDKSAPPCYTFLKEEYNASN